MKELRFNAVGGAWRVAFAFDPKQKAILLVAADKSGVGQKRFCRGLIRMADERFDGFSPDQRQKGDKKWLSALTTKSRT